MRNAGGPLQWTPVFLFQTHTVYQLLVLRTNYYFQRLDTNWIFDYFKQWIGSK